MNKSTKTLNIFLRSYVKKLSKHTIKFYLRIVTWKIMKEISGKCKRNSNRFLKSINVNSKVVKKNSHIAEEFDNYSTHVGPNLASKMQNTSKKILYLSL